MNLVKRNISLLLFGLVLANPVFAVAAQDAKNPEVKSLGSKPTSDSVYAKIKGIYLPAIGALADENMPKPQDNQGSSSWWPWGKKDEKPELEIKPLSVAEKKTMAFDLLAFNDHTQPTGFLSRHSWEDLELFEQANLLRTLTDKHARTSFGPAVVGKMLVTAGDPDVARARQKAIKELVANDSELQRIDHALQIAGMAEDVYLDNFRNEDPAYEEYFAKLYFGSWMGKVLSNENSTLLEAKTRIDNAANAAGLAGSSLFAILAPMTAFIVLARNGGIKYVPPVPQIVGWVCKKNNEVPQEIYDALAKNVKYGSLQYPFAPRGLYELKHVYDHEIKVHPNDKKAISYTMGGIGVITAAMWAYLANGGYNGFKYQYDALNYLQGKLIPLGSTVRAMNALNSLLGHNEVLKAAMPQELQNLHRIIGGASTNAKLDELIRLLNTDTFTDSASVVSLHGRVLAAHKLMQEVKYELRDALEALGTIDAIASMAKLYKEYASQDNKYCFVNLTSESQPHLKAVNFWNPLVSTKKPVPNTVELGAVGKNRSMILTGQNTAGKSTTLRSLLQGVLLAHTFGIAPAQAMDLTPSKFIRTHINIHDDVAHGVSHFKAEVNNVEEIQKAVLALTPGERCFVVIDELFHTTGPQSAVPAARKFFIGIAKFSNVMVISSTHFPELIQLEQETNGLYKNYKMEIHKVNGKLVRPHKIEEGSTTANVAEEILAEQGVTFFA